MHTHVQYEITVGIKIIIYKLHQFVNKFIQKNKKPYNLVDSYLRSMPRQPNAKDLEHIDIYYYKDIACSLCQTMRVLKSKILYLNIFSEYLQAIVQRRRVSSQGSFRKQSR